VIFLDTSGVLALVSLHEPFHAAAAANFVAAQRCLIHNYVLAELVPLARERGVPVIRMLDALANLLSGKGIACVWVDRAMHERAVALLRKRPDKDYSLCDAVSFLVMQQHGETEALTTDHHFEQEGFVRLLKP
jgi:predicted nucleic acid-binding protein